MASKEFPDGVFDFRSLVAGDYYFVDKTMMIKDVCRAGGKVLLYTRPRRFGKSINLSMLDYYFNQKYKDNPDIFRNLKISSCEECAEHKNAYPVIRMDFSSLYSSSPNAFEDSLKGMVSVLAKNVLKELSNKNIDRADTETLMIYSSRTINEFDLNQSIQNICGILENSYGKKVMILVDEYDHCFQNIASEETYNAIVGRIRPFMEATFKTNYHMRTGVITGIMPLAKAGMLSSFNNAVVCDIFNTIGDELFGFTEKEVSELLKETDLDQPGVMEEIRKWYDGYRFGNAEVYNPYSVIKFLSSKSENSGSAARGYWEGSTGAGISSDLISRLNGIALQELKSLYENPESKIRTPVQEFLAYPDLFADNADPSLVYSYLAMAGYLKAEPADEKTPDGKIIYDVGMVNREIRPAFESLVSRSSKRRRVISRSLKQHLISGNPNAVRDDLQFLLAGFAMDKTWSGTGTEAHDRYKNALTAALRTCGMEASEEIPKGFGKCDIFIPGTGTDPAIVIEIKTSSETVPEASADKAYEQIVEKGYASEPLDGKTAWVALGIRGKMVSVITPRGFSD